MFLIISTMSLFNSYNIIVITSERKMSINPRGEVDHMYCCFRLKCLVFQLIMAQSEHELGIYMTYEMIK